MTGQNSKKIKLSAIVIFFIKNFTIIKKTDDFTLESYLQVYDITNSEEHQMMQSYPGYLDFPGYYNNTYRFFDKDGVSWGFIETDFIDEKLVNLRIQLFSETILSSFLINKKHKELKEFLAKEYFDFMNDEANKRLIWYDNKRNLILTVINENKPRKYLSFTITDKRYA